MLATDPLQSAKLRLNGRAQKKLGRLAGNCGVDVIDELGCVSGSLLHADALRKTYGRSLRYNLQTTAYMKPQETWGRMAAKIHCGDLLQLPPVPAEASLMAPTTGQSYEHLQGRKLLADIEHVVDFVQMQRFTDPLLVDVLEAMRTPGGQYDLRRSLASHPADGAQTQRPAAPRRQRVVRVRVRVALRLLRHARACQARRACRWQAALLHPSCGSSVRVRPRKESLRRDAR